MKNLRIVLLLAIPVFIAACTHSDEARVDGVGITNTISTRDPAKLLIILADTTAPEDSRKEADSYFLQQKPANDPKRLAVLETFLFLRGSSDVMRIYAIDQIVAADPARAARSFSNYLPKMPDGPALAHACDVAAKLKNDSVTGAMLRSLELNAKPGQWAARPEARALESLTAQPLDKALQTTFLQTTDTETRLAAIRLIVQVSGIDAARQFVLALPADARKSPLAANLVWSVETFEALPACSTELLWITELRLPQNAALVAAAQKRHAQLKKEIDYTFEFRFVYVLAHVDDATAALGRMQLIDDIQTRLSRVEHAKRDPLYPGAPDDRPETLEGNSGKLTRCDLFTIRLLLNAFADGPLDAQLLLLGHTDRVDKSTEHGGLLTIDPQKQLIATDYPPQFKATDFQYAVSDQLLRLTVTGLAQYHMHFQQPENQRIASPGVGDIVFTKNNRTSSIVFTSISDSRFNADYYTPDNAVLDLGVYP